ncbi:MAG: ORF6C domain-containing protein [Chloroflexi bacterium]|nr:ORF6C domain-containing protein [Chloroflexota bacterium]
MRPLCDYLGLNWDGQRRRMNRDAVLSEEVMSVVVTTTDIAPDSRRPRTSAMLCLPLDFINGFLFGINATRVKDEIREQLIRYQRECYRVLADAFLQQETAAADDWMTTSPETRAALHQIQEMGLAIAQMAQEQLRIMERLDNAAIVVGQHNRRIIALERQLAPREAITDEQATDIAETVKALAMMLTEHDNSKNHFQAIFAELHRRYRVTSYKNIRQSQYQAVLDFLGDWLAAAEDE